MKIFALQNLILFSTTSLAFESKKNINPITSIANECLRSSSKTKNKDISNDVVQSLLNKTVLSKSIPVVDCKEFLIAYVTKHYGIRTHIIKN